MGWIENIHKLRARNLSKMNKIKRINYFYKNPAILDLDLKSDLTCNERSECESRTTKPCHCDELAKKQSLSKIIATYFNMWKEKVSHSPYCYFSGKRFISPTKVDKIMWASILINGLKPEDKNLNQRYTIFLLVACKQILFYKLPACRINSASKDAYTTNQK